MQSTDISALSIPSMSPAPAPAAIVQSSPVEARQSRLEQHLERVAAMAMKSGYAGPKNASLIDFVEAQMRQAAADRCALEQIQATLRQAGLVLQSQSAPNEATSPSALAEGIRQLVARTRSQEETIAQLAGGLLMQPSSEVEQFAQTLAARSGPTDHVGGSTAKSSLSGLASFRP